MELIFGKGTPADAPLVVALLGKRIDWMDAQGISQWPREYYLGFYNEAYFKKRAEKGELWVLKDGKTLTGCAVLLEKDLRWGNDCTPAYYVHNLATDPSLPGAGAFMLDYFESIARKAGKKALRLDCKTGAKKINYYYRKRGFRFAGFWKQLEYKGNRREKLLA